MAYIPQQGDIVTLDFDPQSGHEQKGRRPALVISNNAYNRGTKMFFVCPITNTDRGYTLHVNLSPSTSVQGVIMCDQAKSLDYISRNAIFVEKVPSEILEEVCEIVKEFFEII